MICAQTLIVMDAAQGTQNRLDSSLILRNIPGNDLTIKGAELLSGDVLIVKV